MVSLGADCGFLLSQMDTDKELIFTDVFQAATASRFYLCSILYPSVSICDKYCFFNGNNRSLVSIGQRRKRGHIDVGPADDDADALAAQTFA